MSQPQLTLYHAPMSRSVRVRWCLEEMGLPYTLERVEPITPQSRGNLGGEALKAVSPLQKVPVLKDGEATMLESVAMVDYLVTKYGPTELAVRPDEADYARYLEWLHFAEGAMSMAVNLTLAHGVFLPEDKRNPALFQWARAELDKLLALLGERGFEDGREFLAGGRLTGADIAIGYLLFLLKIVKQFDGAPENVRVYFDRLRAREAWKTASAD